MTRRRLRPATASKPGESIPAPGAAPCKRKPGVPDPAQHASVWPRLVHRVAEEGHTVCISQLDEVAMSRLEALALKQQWFRYRAALKSAVKAGEVQWESILAQARMVAVSVTLSPGGKATVSWWNRERTASIRALETALAETES